MPRRLLLLADLGLLVLAGWLGLEVYGIWRGPDRPVALAPSLSKPGAAVSEEPDSPPPPVPPAAGYGVIAERNLFNPNRTETSPEPPKASPPATAQPPPPPPPPRPRLYGVVLGADAQGRAYLEDPRTRKVYGYTIGDTVAESRLERIEPDRVVMRRGDEVFEVLLRDPTKPKPPPAAVPAPGASRPGVPPGASPGRPVPGSPGVQPFPTGEGQPPAASGGVFPTGPPGSPRGLFQPAPLGAGTAPTQPAAPGAVFGTPGATAPAVRNPFQPAGAAPLQPRRGLPAPGVPVSPADPDEGEGNDDSQTGGGS